MDTKPICLCGKELSKEKIGEIKKEFKKNWEEVFDYFYDPDTELGSSAWKVTPMTVKNFIRGLLKI